MTLLLVLGGLDILYLQQDQVLQVNLEVPGNPGHLSHPVQKNGLGLRVDHGDLVGRAGLAVLFQYMYDKAPPSLLSFQTSRGIPWAPVSPEPPSFLGALW